MDQLEIVEVAAMPAFVGVDVPTDFWWGLLAPTPLAGMRYPSHDFNWRQAAELGFGHVVCLTTTTPAYDPSPLRCTGVNLQDLIGGRSPQDPVAELAQIRRGVETVTTSLGRGEGVLVHCVGGRGRSGTVIGAALVSLGADPDHVAEWQNRVHLAREAKAGLNPHGNAMCSASSVGNETSRYPTRLPHAWHPQAANPTP